MSDSLIEGHFSIVKFWIHWDEIDCCDLEGALFKTFQVVATKKGDCYCANLPVLFLPRSLVCPCETRRARQLSRLPTASAEQCADGFAGRPRTQTPQQRHQQSEP